MRPEHAALLALADPGDNGAAAALARLRSPGDRRRFAELALSEGIAGHLWFEVLRRRLGALVGTGPPALRLRDEYESLLRANTWRLLELRQVLEALKSAGIAAAPLDAAALFLAALVPTRGVRALDHLVLGVHGADPAAVSGVLARAGLRVESTGEAALGAVTPRATPFTLELLGAAAPADPHWHLAYTAERLAERAAAEPTLLTEIDRLYLRRHPAAAALAPAFADKTALARGLVRRAARPPFTAQLRALLLPPSEEMVRAHGSGAAGFGLYRLYAKRLLLLKRRLTATRREDAGAP